MTRQLQRIGIALVLSVVGWPALPAVGAQGAGGQGPGQGARGPARAQAGRPPAEQPIGTAIIRGQIVAADTGTPLRRAQVGVSSSDARESRLATTDAQGRFEVKELPAGRYTVTASKAGFVTLQYGQRRPSESGTPLELSDGQTLDKLAIALPRGSVLGGRVTDEFGEPVANATVVAMRYAYAAGGRRLMPAAGASSRDTTDDQGQYRLFGLPPGEYYVSATLRTGGGEVTDPMGEPSGYAATYFPGVASMVDATRVTLGVAQENTNVSFGLIATRLVKVSGHVLASDGNPASGGVVMLMPADGASGGRGGFMPQGGGGGRIDQTGLFRLTGVAPGRYRLQARPGMRGGGESARMDLNVGADDVDGLTMVMAPGATVTGSVITDTGEPPDFRASQLQIAARAADAGMPGFGFGGGGARVADDWTFELGNLTDAQLIRATAPQGWALKAVFLIGQEITDTPMEFPQGRAVSGVQVVLTRKVSALSGAVTDSRGRLVLDATVVVFPSDDTLWGFQSRFIKAARPDQQGQYRINALPPAGGYLVVALQGLEDGQAGDPAFLATIRDLGKSFAIAEGETKNVDVELKTRP